MASSSHHDGENGPSRKEKRRLCAVLLADAVQSTAAMHQAEEATVHSLKTSLDMMIGKTSGYDGAVVNHTGDGFLAVFDSVIAAASFAVDMIEELEILRDRGTLTGDIRFRFGLHFGDVIVKDDQYFGDAINLAARLEGAADPGHVCTSRAVYDQIRMKLDYCYDFKGPYSFKGMSEPVDVYEIEPKREAATAFSSVRQEHRNDQLWESLLEKPSVAVLPFKNLSSDPEQEFFADGITEDIITNLSRFRGLSVIARASVFVLKNHEAPTEDVSRRFGVRYVVNGSVRRAGNRIRVSVELNDAVHRRALWSERYDRDIEDIFDVQSEITEIAVAAMAVQIEAAEQDRMRAIAPPSLAAYGLILQGQNLLFHYTQKDNHKAREFYEQGVAHSNTYARGLAAVSRTHNLDWRYHWTVAPDASLDQAREFALTAIEADQGDARGHAELGYVRLYRKEHNASIDAYKRAVALNPSDANILMEYADTLSHAGQPEEAVRIFEKAMRLNPYYPDDYLWGLAGAQFKLALYDEALENIARMNNPAQGQRLNVACLALSGRLDDAKRHAEMVREAQPNFNAEAWKAVVPDVSEEAKDRFIEALRIAGL